MTDPIYPPMQPLVPVTATGRPRRRGGIANLLLLGAGLVAAAGIAFAVGRTTASTTSTAFGPAVGGFGGTGQGAPDASFAPGAGGPGRMGGSLTMAGTVTAVNGTTLTIQTADGQTVTVDTSGATYHSQTAASASDVAAGDSVQVAVSGFGGGPNASPGTAGSSSSTSAGSPTATDVTIVPGS